MVIHFFRFYWWYFKMQNILRPHRTQLAEYCFPAS